MKGIFRIGRRHGKTAEQLLALRALVANGQSVVVATPEGLYLGQFAPQKTDTNSTDRPLDNAIG